MEKLLAWQKTIQEKNLLKALEAEELIRLTREREMMAQEDILAHKIRNAVRYGNKTDITLPG